MYTVLEQLSERVKIIACKKFYFPNYDATW